MVSFQLFLYISVKLLDSETFQIGEGLLRGLRTDIPRLGRIEQM